MPRSSKPSFRRLAAVLVAATLLVIALPASGADRRSREQRDVERKSQRRATQRTEVVGRQGRTVSRRLSTKLEANDVRITDDKVVDMRIARIERKLGSEEQKAAQDEKLRTPEELSRSRRIEQRRAREAAKADRVQEQVGQKKRKRNRNPSF